MGRDVEKETSFLTPRLRDTAMTAFTFHVKQNDRNYLIIRTYAL